MRCKVCRRRFTARKDNKYTVTEQKGFEIIPTPRKIYECFDCPKCGCQNIVNIREVKE